MTELFLPYASPIVEPKTGKATNAMMAWMRGITPQASSAASGITALTGDVTATGPGSAVATIANNAVTFAKMQDIATQTLIGRNTAGTGDPESVSISTALDWLP
jgi:hypothetical protein